MSKENRLAIDASKLSYNELIKHRAELDRLVKEAEALIESKRSEELKVLADGYVKKAEAAGFSIQEATEALKPYWPKQTAGNKKSKAGTSTAVVHYRDPADASNTWSGRGRPARWLADYEATGRNREEFKVG